MCGIVGAVSKSDIVQSLLSDLQVLTYRGYDSSGIVVHSESAPEPARLRRPGKVADLITAVAANDISGTWGLGHVRWATHGAAVEVNAQPHVSCNNVCLVHNGIVENHTQLRDELNQMGYRFSSDTDTEVIVHLIHHFHSRGESLLSSVQSAIKKLDGSYAFAVTSKDSPYEIIAARGGCPLVVGIQDGRNLLASDIRTLARHTDSVVVLQEGDVVQLTLDDVRIYDSNDEPIEREIEKVSTNTYTSDKGTYRHFMEKEIHEQPEVVRATLEGRISANHVLESGFGIGSAEIFNQTKAVTVVGCGTSYYAACVARYWIEDIAGIPCSAEIASEFRYRNMKAPSGSLLITISQSGETADTIEAQRIARDRGFEFVANIGNVPTSTLVVESDLAILMHAGAEISVCSTKAFIAMLVDLLLITCLLARQLPDWQAREEGIITALRSLDRKLEEILGLEKEIQKVADEFVHKHHALFLGRGTAYPVALEGALKLKEITYIHAEGYPAGELKHGPLALVDENMPVVVVAPNDDLMAKVQSNIEEVRARGGELYVFADPSAAFGAKDRMKIIRLPEIHPMLIPVAYVVPLQLLAYHVARSLGTDIDQPRNLAKSVTVE